ncbi:Uncharacterised protein [Zhongshania aliphaticivorans]|uniref:Preprotein translocase subunit YajC n=1 Tax=Zhongshania aliphaticivorans TaxID=1470434 RepID=A0A5S9QDB9_9GAMM|nr:hypothetical protein [Zhongshania aliphaticivorans]CAA0088280.1 Uncharacterised protein [Zhongshania aliphaticivorans]CAA0116269.1 Uncharacterised protein [Zhongshania aliphaticivorans]CAA0120403.1 Uncharacterised protein [Zhongshania aliphaticivorans]
MGWLIAVVVIGFMLAPVMWILPSRRQTQQAQIRTHARSLGLSVKVVAMPKTRRAKVRREEDVFGVCYSRFLPNSKSIGSWKYWLIDVAEDEDEDDTLSLDADLLQTIKKYQHLLPRDASMLELTPLGLNIYWREVNASADVVTNISECFDAIISDTGLENGVKRSE